MIRLIFRLITGYKRLRESGHSVGASLGILALIVGGVALVTALIAYLCIFL